MQQPIIVKSITYDSNISEDQLEDVEVITDIGTLKLKRIKDSSNYHRIGVNAPAETFLRKHKILSGPAVRYDCIILEDVIISTIPRKTIRNIIFFKGSKIMQHIGSICGLKFTSVDRTKGKPKQLIDIYNKFKLS